MYSYFRRDLSFEISQQQLQIARNMFSDFKIFPKVMKWLSLASAIDFFSNSWDERRSAFSGKKKRRSRKAKIELNLFYVKANYYHFLRLHIDLLKYLTL